MYHEEEIVKREEVKTVAFIADKKNPAIQKKFYSFFHSNIALKMISKVR